MLKHAIRVIAGMAGKGCNCELCNQCYKMSRNSKGLELSQIELDPPKLCNDPLELHLGKASKD